MVLQVPASVVFVFFHVGREVNYSSRGKRCTSALEVQASRESEPRRVKSSGKLLTPFSERTVFCFVLFFSTDAVCALRHAVFLVCKYGLWRIDIELKSSEDGYSTCTEEVPLFL